MPSSLIVILSLFIFAIGFTTLSVTALPLAMEHADNFNKVFCVCIFFAGAALPEGILEIATLL